MAWVVRNIERIMIVSGVLTLTMVYATIAPDSASRSNFGATIDGPAGDLVVRNWGALIGLIGAMLVYAARRPPLRPLALTVAGLSKAVFVILVLSNGTRFLGYQAGLAVMVDSVWVMLFVAYLIATRPPPSPDRFR